MSYAQRRSENVKERILEHGRSSGNAAAAKRRGKGTIFLIIRSRLIIHVAGLFSLRTNPLPGKKTLFRS